MCDQLNHSGRLCHADEMMRKICGKKETVGFNSTYLNADGESSSGHIGVFPKIDHSGNVDGIVLCL